MFLNAPDPATQARLQHQARAEAVRLRQAAVDDFWRGADAVLQRGLQDGPARAARGARRLQARLARHWLDRGASVLEG